MPGPLVTPDQLHIESRALDLRMRGDVQAIARRVAQHWKDALEPNAEHIERFDDEFEQALFCGLMNTVNADPARPRVHAFGRFAHDLDGRAVPATKSGHPNPDYIYRFMPIEGETRYVLRGQITGEMPTAVEIGMLTGEQFYQHNISRRDIVVGADGRFTITIDPDPANGRPNHFQSTPDSRQLLMRDILGELARQRPLDIHVESVQSAAGTLPDSDDALAAACEAHILQASLLLSERFDLSAAEKGLILSSSALVAIVAAGLYGWLRRFLSVTQVFALNALCFGIGMLLTATASVPGLVALGCAFIGFGGGTTEPAGASAALSRLPASYHGRASGLVVSSVFLGQFLNPLAIAPARAWGGTGVAFAAFGIMMLIVATALAALDWVARRRGRNTRSKRLRSMF